MEESQQRVTTPGKTAKCWLLAVLRACCVLAFWRALSAKRVKAIYGGENSATAQAFLCRLFTAAVWCVPALRVPLVHSLKMNGGYEAPQTGIEKAPR